MCIFDTHPFRLEGPQNEQLSAQPRTSSVDAYLDTNEGARGVQLVAPGINIGCLHAYARRSPAAAFLILQPV